MQWSTLTKCGLFFNVVPRRSSHFFHRCCSAWIPWYRSSHLDPGKSHQLQIWPHHRSDTASQPSVFFILGNRNNGAKSQEYGGLATSSKHMSCTTIANTDLCAGAFSWWNRTPSVFQAVFNLIAFRSCNVGIVFPIDSLAFLKVVNEHNALCIPQDGGHHHHHVQEKWLDLVQKVPRSPPTWPTWCAFDQASKAVAPTAPSRNLRHAKFGVQNVLSTRSR